MTISGELLNGQVSFALDGTVSMSAGVELKDDVLGRLAMRSVPVTDPAVIAQVQTFVEQMLPSLSAALGVPVTLPQGAQPQPEPGE